MHLTRNPDFATTLLDGAPANDGARTGSGAGNRRPSDAARQGHHVRASTPYRTVTSPRRRIGVDYVLIGRNRPGFQNRKAPENINVFRGFFGCGGRI